MSHTDENQPDDSENRPREHDYPPASGSPYPYPSRLARLNRALRSTANLLSDMEDSAASNSDRDYAAGSSNRRRRFSLMDTEDLPPHLQHASEFPMSSERETNQRPAKRRRYDAPNPVSLARTPISYGHYGQVEPGCLKMEIISCDGGDMVDHRSPRVYLGYQNVLKSDKSVYCSAQSQVSMVLRHADTTAFSIDKLHIVAPENGFDAPVMSGTILVAFELEHLKKYQDRPNRPHLADKHISQDTRLSRIQRLRSRCPGGELSLAEALRDPEIAAFYHDYSIAPGSTDDPLHSSFDSISDFREGSQSDSRWDARTSNETPLLQDNVATTHTYDDDDQIPADTSTPEVIEYRNHRQHTRPRQRSGLFNGGPYYPMMAPSSQHWTDRAEARSPGQVDQGSQTEPQDQPGPTADPVRSSNEHQIPPWHDPHVHYIPFKMEKGKSRVSIKFEPQISARFILLKLGAGKNNVDVQSIVVSGFAGPRFFPAKQLR